MSTLQKLRGAPFHRMPLLGRTLTLYGPGARRGGLVALATVLLFNLPWRLIPAVGEALQPAMAVMGFYGAATLIGSLTDPGLDETSAARRWL